MFEVSRPYLVAAIGVLLAQAILIIGLLAERVRRQRADRDARRTREDLAHDLNQPLTGILCNARAAMHLLALPNPPLHEMRQILQDIVDDDKRASEVIVRIRDVVKSRATERAKVDVEEVFSAR
jgi:signal transduction histidine kinase